MLLSDRQDFLPRYNTTNLARNYEYGHSLCSEMLTKTRPATTLKSHEDMVSVFVRSCVRVMNCFGIQH
jgi:hypothetical protein